MRDGMEDSLGKLPCSPSSQKQLASTPSALSTPSILHSTAIMSLDPPLYILSLQNNIRARPISWEGAVRAKTISDNDLAQIKKIDKVRKEQRKQTIEDDVKTYTTLLLGDDGTKSIFESAAKRLDILQYMLVLTGDLVDGRTDRSQVCEHELTAYRYPRADRIAHQTPASIQSAPTSTETIEQPRRPRSASHIFSPRLSDITCSQGTAKVHARD